MPRAHHTHPSWLKVNHRYLPRCLALILFTCCLTSLAFPPASGRSGGPSLDQTGADLAQTLAGASSGCSGSIFGAAPVAVGSSPHSVAVADFNGDGKADIVTANLGSNDVSILLSNGDGSFQTAVNYGVGANPLSVAVGDFNGDGKLDVVTANYNSDDVTILLGNGDSTFQMAVNYRAGSYPRSVAAGDFNGDSKPDLAVVSTSGVSILLGNGNGTFQTPVTYSVGSTFGSVAIGDFNGDGKPDLAMPNDSNSNVSIFLGNGNGTFQSAVSYHVSGPRSVAIGDFNGDGKADLAVASFYDNNVSILLGNGNGTFQTAVNYSVGSYPNSLSAGDFNGDGKADVAVANSGSNNVSILLGNGNGTFQTQVTYGVGSSPYSVAAGDFNADGKLDLAVANNGSNNVSILLGNGNGTFQTQINYGVGSNPYSVAVGDFNGDGKPDLAVANANSNNISILLRNGDGSFQAGNRYGAGGSPFFIAVGDLNGDGKVDLVVANTFSNNIAILLGNGDGSFQAASRYDAGSSPVSVAVGDFNGDGRPDIAAANSASLGGVSILLGNGDGSFQSPVNFSAGGWLSSVVSGDFNGDGKTDLAVANYSSSISILLGKGDGTFQTAVSYGAGPSTYSVAVGDFNGDGKPDLAVANRDSNNVSILLGKGDGTFQTAVSYGVGSNAYSVAVGDFNGDGKPDLAVANANSNNVSILLGNGNGTFQTAVSYGVGSNPYSVAVGDFNGDGKPDLAVANYGSNSVSILLNTSTCTAISLTSLSPSSATAGGPAFSLTAHGSNFVSGSTVNWNLRARSTTFSSSTQVLAAIPASDIATGGTAQVTVSNPDGSGSPPLQFVINNLAPTVTGLSPASATAGGAAFTLTVNGANFVGSSTVQWNASNRTTTFVSSTQLTAAITAADIASVGTARVTVFNPTPGGGTSGTQTFYVNNPVPAISSLSPPSAIAGGTAFTLTVNGTNFVSLSTVQWNGSSRTTTFVSSTQLTAAITAADIAVAGTASVTVINPSPGGGTSGAQTFYVNNPVPSISSLSPASTIAGRAAFTLTVNGANLLSTSTVQWNGSSRTTAFVNSTQLTASIPASDSATVGNANVTVVNPAPGGGTSSPQTFTINNPLPTLTSISPAGATAGGVAFTLTANGTNFLSTSTVRWNGSNRTTAFVSGTQLTAAITAADIAGTVTVTVFNPTPGGGTSNGQSFTINNPTPTLTSLSPSSATAGGSAFMLTVSGSNFVSGSTVRWNGSDRTTTYISGSQLTAAITAADIASAGTASVTVANPSPGGGASAALSFTINNPTPSITSLTPPSATVGGAAFTLTVNGSNFVSTSSVMWNGSSRTTTFVSSTQVTAAITAADIAVAGTASVTVVNPSPGGGTSGAQTFSVNNPVPSISSLSPSSAIAGSAAFTLTVNGTNLLSSSTVQWNGSIRTTTFVSSTIVTAAITAADITSAGTASVIVVNPSPGGGMSSALSFIINNPAPSITSLSPASATVGGAAFTLTVTGTNFLSTSALQWNGSSRTTTLVSSTQLTGSIPASDIATAGSAQIKVFNPAPGGGFSNSLSFQINPGTNCAAQRMLPDGYRTGQAFQVTIQVTPLSGTQTYAVEDTPPSEWVVSGIDNGGQWDKRNAKVKWGPYFDSQARTLHYSVTPPAEAMGTYSFIGTLSMDGVNSAVCGSSNIAPLTSYHPADTSNNWRIVVGEVTAYGSAWKSGTTWKNPPNPIPIGYVTNAGLIWISGEVYHYDSSQTPPFCWVPGASSGALRQMSLRSQVQASGSGSAVSSFNSTSYTPGVGVVVSIAVTPDASTQVYAVEDAPPSGWTVSGIDNGGQFDSANRKVKWGLFFDNTSRTLTYTATPPAGETGTKTFAGVASFDGTNVTIGGARTLSACCAGATLAVGMGRFGTNGGWVSTHAGKDGGFALQSWLHLPWDAYNATGGGIHVAVGDVDGDGLDEIVLGLGTGGGGWIAVLDDSAHGYALLKWIQVGWDAYNASNGEVFPAVGDIDGDGRAEIIAGLGTGSQGWIEIFGNASTGYQHVAWRQVAWPAYNAANGTTHPAVGDLDGDGKAEIVLGLGSGGGGWIEVIQSSAGDYNHGSWLQVNWPDYNASNGTTYPAVGDIDGDGRAEIVIGLGQGSLGWVEFLDDKAAGYAHLKWFQLPWDAYDNSNGEIHPAVGNVDADSRAEIVFGLGRFQGQGGWLFALDDATSNYATLGWFQVPWNAFSQDGGETFPAIGPPR